MSERSPEGQDPSQYKDGDSAQDRDPLFTRIRRSKPAKGLAAGAAAGAAAFGAHKLTDREPEGPVKPAGTPQAEQAPRTEGAYYGSLYRVPDGAPVTLHGEPLREDNTVDLDDDEGSIELPGHFDAERKTVVIDIDKAGISPEEARDLVVYTDVAINGEVQPFSLGSSVADGRIEANVSPLTGPEPPNPTPMGDLPENDLKKNPPPSPEEGAPPLEDPTPMGDLPRNNLRKNPPPPAEEGAPPPPKQGN